MRIAQMKMELRCPKVLLDETLGGKRGVATDSFLGGEGSELQWTVGAKIIAKLKGYKSDKELLSQIFKMVWKQNFRTAYLVDSVSAVEGSKGFMLRRRVMMPGYRTPINMLHQQHIQKCTFASWIGTSPYAIQAYLCSLQILRLARLPWEYVMIISSMDPCSRSG